jgi:CBS domain-containing protein
MVKDLMTIDLVWVLIEESVMEAARIMTLKGISSVLVRSKDKFEGILTEHDIVSRVVALGLDPNEIMIGEVMSSPLITISEDTSIEGAAEKMRDNKIRRLLVKNELCISGIISESDIVRVEPELHLLIREKTRLNVYKTDNISKWRTSFAGFCEECENYFDELDKVNGRWLCEECRS